MHRTQLYLDDDIYRTLVAAATRERSTLSELVRQALRRLIAEAPPIDPAAAVAQAVGAWAGRRDLSATETYLRRLRKDSRGRRLGLAVGENRRR